MSTAIRHSTWMNKSILNAMHLNTFLAIFVSFPRTLFNTFEIQTLVSFPSLPSLCFIILNSEWTNLLVISHKCRRSLHSMTMTLSPLFSKKRRNGNKRLRLECIERWSERFTFITSSRRLHFIVTNTNVLIHIFISGGFENVLWNDANTQHAKNKISTRWTERV